ncbi:hypothetical protein TrRE_jg10456 [Triparma retinervis]|uniref:EF-hand domain-containing protein n=1 Tax=Triparma retinervis TaxID=2557542 RepID=A0A9W7L2F6_9STRA|nr:hypothetical protein TrRE_jg10456 [Triparma retinervis]
MGQCKSAPKTADTADGNKDGDPSVDSTPDHEVDGEESKEKKKKKGKKKKLSKAQKEVDTVLNHLNVPSRAVTKFLVFFKKMDDDESGSISLEEFIVFLELETYYVPFIERCFGAMDFNKKGKSKGALDPTEFTVGLYNLCVMTRDLLEDYVFELYDEIHDGNLYPQQVEKMVIETSAHAPTAAEALVNEVFKALDTDDDGHISKKEFFHLDSKAEMLLRPMYLMQTTLQKRCLGENFWDEERVRMQKMMEKYSEKTILDLLANRVAAKYEAEREKEALMRGEKLHNEKEEKKRAMAANVKGFGSERKLKGAGGISFASDAGAPIFATDLKDKQKEQEKKRKAKLKAKKKKMIEEAIANGEDPEKFRRKKTSRKKSLEPTVAVSVRGAAKPAADSSYAMKHREELAVNQKGRTFD